MKISSTEYHLCLHLKTGHHIGSLHPSAFNGLYCAAVDFLIAVLCYLWYECVFPVPERKVFDVSKNEKCGFRLSYLRWSVLRLLSIQWSIFWSVLSLLLSIYISFCTTCKSRLNSLVNNCKMSFPYSAHTWTARDFKCWSIFLIEFTVLVFFRSFSSLYFSFFCYI